MDQHTPGPWSDPCTYGASRFEVHGTGSPPAHRRIAVADTLADARLIAAAPELLAALRGMLAYYTGGALNHPVHHAAVAAIARAEGRP
jgi:hypothetical protein